MPQGSFSAQLERQQEQQQQTRISRSQRKGQADRERVARANFELWQKEAERLKAEEFIDKDIEEKYYEYVPRDYVTRGGEITKDWQRLRDEDKARLLKEYSERDLVRFERTRVVRDPFTFEEYGQKYEQLDPNIKQFFLSPQEITSQQEQAKQKERDLLQSFISKTQIRLQEAQKRLQDYREWMQRQKGDRGKDGEIDRERDVEELEDTISNAQAQAGKIDKGATAQDIWDYAENKADYNRQRREAKASAREKFNQEVATGNLDADLVKLGLSKQGLTYDKFISKVGDYNKNVAYVQQLQKWGSNVGFANLPDWAKEKINPSAIAWQKQNPTEKLIFDKMGNVVGVESGGLKQSFSLAGYTAQQEKLSADYEKQKKMISDANALLKEQGFAEGVDLRAKPKENWLQQAWSGIKAGYLASPFGAGFSLPERSQQYATAVRESRVKEAFKPDFSDVNLNIAFGGGGILPTYKFFTLPLKTSWNLVEEQEDLNYKGEQAGKLLEQLETISGGVSPEMKPFVEAEGLKILQTKGLLVKQETVKEGDVETTTLKISDPAFDRRISQNMLEWERELEKEGTLDKGTWRQLAPTSLNKVFLEARIGSSKVLETYGIVKVIGWGARGVVWGAKSVATLTNLKLPAILTQRTVQLAEGTAVVPRTYGATKTALGLGISGLYVYAKAKQFQAYSQTSKGGKSLFLLETAGEVGGIELSTGWIQKSFKRGMNRIENFSLKTVKQADISQTGFMRMNKNLGFQERVFMDRYQGFKLKSPRSWLQTVQGYKKGQFTGRSYKFIPDEVLANYKYGGDVTIYREPKTLKGMLKAFSKNRDQGMLFAREPYKTIKAEAFPYDDASTHLEWFLRKNYAEFGVPKRTKLPIKVKGKGFGYSATGDEWTASEFKPSEVFYNDRGLIKSIKIKGAYQYYSGKGVSAGFLRIFKKAGEESALGKSASKPTIYAGYFDEVRLNRAIREIKGVDLSGRELKAYLYSKQTGQAGTLNIPLYKREVEGTVEIAKRIPIRRAIAIKLEGWKIPIEEQVFGGASTLSQKELKAIIKEMGSITEITGKQYSSLPSKASSFSGFYSTVSFPSYSSTISAVSKVSGMSAVSRVSSKISELSKISTPSRTSRMSDFSYSSVVSEIMRKISYSSSTSTPKRSSKPFRSSLLDSELLSKVKMKIKMQNDFETLALLPDFTARAIGLSPKEVSIKDAMKEIRKIQTGFDIRTGVRVKGFSPIDEKSLLRGIMQ